MTAQIRTLVKNIKAWTPDRDILEVRDMLVSLRDLTKQPLTFISPRDVAKTKKWKTPRDSSLWGVDNKGYCLIKHGTAWDFTIKHYGDYLESAIQAGGIMAEKYMNMVRAQQDVPAREKYGFNWRHTEAMMDMVRDAMDREDTHRFRSVQTYIDHLMFEDFKKKGLIE